MDISHHHIETKKTARYSTYGRPSEHTKYFWFLLHGSNMTCEQMLYKFSDFDPEEHYIVAAEGLNRFYANGFSGDVVASWMTSRDRLEEINDFSEYLTTLYERNIDLIPKEAKKIALGFSQGGTTMYRWLHRVKIDVDVLIPYSCWIPEDIDLTASKTEVNSLETYYTYGLQDQHLSAEVIAKVTSIAERNKLQLTFEPHENDHRVDRKQLQSLFATYIK